MKKIMQKINNIKKINFIIKLFNYMWKLEILKK